MKTHVQKICKKLWLKQDCMIRLKKDKNDRDSTFEYGNKCIDLCLTTNGMLEIMDGMEMLDCKEIIELDHIGCLIDLNLGNDFSETLVDAKYT